ncbi:MAG: GDSL-type esterase/lipase family protein [Verrucomicrobiota bacterium]
MKRIILLLTIATFAHAAPTRVACLGDSITHGVGADAGWSWPEQLDRMLDSNWDVRNYGHSGASVAKEEKHTIWSQKEYKDALAFHPDIVVILLGTNDRKPQNWEHKTEFPKLYKELVVSFQSLSSKPRVFCGTPPYVAKKGAFGITEAGVKEQIPMITEVATNLGAVVVDVHAATEAKDELFKDNVHPNTAGAAIIAKAVYQALAGKEWEGEIPSATTVKKDKPLVRVVENPGELSYRELFALIASECELSSDKMAPIREKFDETGQEVETKIHNFESKIAEYDQLRMKYKHTKEDSEKSLYGEYRAKIAATKQELAKYKFNMNLALIAMIPSEAKPAFGTGWVHKYVSDRLAPIATAVTPAQRRQIREICRKVGPAYGAINNTPERSIADVETYKTVYQQVLDAEQKKRVEPQ